MFYNASTIFRNHIFVLRNFWMNFLIFVPSVLSWHRIWELNLALYVFVLIFTLLKQNHFSIRSLCVYKTSLCMLYENEWKYNCGLVLSKPFKKSSVFYSSSMIRSLLFFNLNFPPIFTNRHARQYVMWLFNSRGLIILKKRGVLLYFWVHFYFLPHQQSSVS